MNLQTRSKPLERSWRVSEEGAKRSKETREFGERSENLKIESKLLEMSYNMSDKRANRSKETRGFETRSEPLERI